MSVDKAQRQSALGEFFEEFPGVWRNIPYKGLFTASLVLWTLLFEFLGNSTFGYINTHSLFAWTDYSYLTSEDDKHGFFIPFLVLALLWWKRRELASLQARPWLPGLVIVFAALFLHIVGFLAQQARISLAAFFLGLYGLVAMTWGFGALKKTFFPMCLLAFALPLGTLADTITFPLRMLATHLTCTIAGTGLGVNVIRQGTYIYDPSGAFSYEVAAACGGLRSLTAVLALCTIYAFMNLRQPLKIAAVIAAGFPLAVIGNVTRLVLVIIVSEAFGRKWGEFVHDNGFFSLLPYVPPIVGILLMGHFLGERPERNRTSPPAANNKTGAPPDQKPDPDPPMVSGKTEMPATV